MFVHYHLQSISLWELQPVFRYSITDPQMEDSVGASGIGCLESKRKNHDVP